MSVNVTLVGNITREPELRFTNGGKAVAKFGIAVNRRFQANGEWKEQTSFFDVQCWDTLAENVASSLPKGSRVIVSGRIEQRQYETQQGEKRSVYEVTADEVGPSLRWATAQVDRTDRRSADGGAPMGSRSTEPAYAADEEPF